LYKLFVESEHLLGR